MNKYFAKDRTNPERAYIRFPGWLHQAIRDRSKVSGRSKNAEIMDLLVKALEAEKKTVVSEK